MKNVTKRHRKTDQIRRRTLADRVIGALRLSLSHQNWKNKRAVEAWRKEIRADWKQTP